jgi:hypothetical protein
VVGCNTATLNLSITPTTTDGSVTTSICAGDSYVWPLPNGTGLTYTTAQSNLTNVVGCNTATLNLSITPATTDGSVTTSICAGDSYVWPLPNGTGLTYTTAQSNLTNVVGCNMATLNLSIDTVPDPTGNATQTFNVVDPNDATIADIVIDPTTVTWYDSLSDAQSGTNPLSSSTVLVNGHTYWAVNVSGTCSSEPFGVTVTVALGNSEFESLNFVYHPNPTSSILNISCSKVISELTVFNLLGQKLMVKKANATEVQIDLSSLPSANYFIKVIADDKMKIIKIIKQ